jgi:hypothetical protein
VPLGERNAGTRFQVAFEGNCAPPIGKLNDNVKASRTVLASPVVAVGVVFREAPGHI